MCFCGLFFILSEIIIMAKSTAAAKTKKATPEKTATKKPVKKATKIARPAKEEKTINIKYADKSAGQSELVVIFEAIKKMVQPYEKKGAFKLHAGTGGQFNMVSHKPVEIAGRKREELWFVSALVQKGYVGFYFMPIYDNPSMGKLLSPELMKCLKGKACFHIKKNDPVIMKEIEKAIKIGYEAYKKNGWV